jgi:hypothetical protein
VNPSLHTKKHVAYGVRTSDIPILNVPSLNILILASEDIAAPLLATSLTASLLTTPRPAAMPVWPNRAMHLVFGSTSIEVSFGWSNCIDFSRLNKRARFHLTRIPQEVCQPGTSVHTVHCELHLSRDSSSSAYSSWLCI